MSYSKYGNQIANYLKGAGLPPAWATAIGNVFGNASQEMFHAGRQTHDSTRQEHRMVTPHIRKHVLPAVDFLPGDPDYRKPRISDSEQAEPPQPAPTVVVTVSPQESDAPFRVNGGSYVQAVSGGNVATVNLRHSIRGAPVQGLPLALLDPQTGTVVGKALRAEVGQVDQGQVTFEAVQNGGEVVLKLNVDNRAKTEVITDVRYEPGRGLVAKYDTVVLWRNPNGESREKLLATSRIEAASNFQEDADDHHSLHATIKRFEAFAEKDLPDAALPAGAKIGQTASAWAIGTTGSVTVWENGAVSNPAVVISGVKNLCADVMSGGWVVICQTRTLEWVLVAAQPFTVDVVTGASINASGNLEFTKSAVRVAGRYAASSDIIQTSSCAT
jgi:hypothetical protein